MTQDAIVVMPPYLNASYEGDDLFTGEQLRAAVLTEREACAKFFDDNDTNIFWGSQAASHIRARGEQA